MSSNKINIIYIHGLGKTCETSRKFKEIQEHYKNENVIGFDWNQDDYLKEKLINFIDENIKVNEYILIIGSSAGGKVALLMKDILMKYYDTFSMVALLNPLMDVENRTEYNKNVLSNYYLQTGELHRSMKECLMIYSETDNMIDQVRNVLTVPTKNMFLNVGEDNHSLSNSSDKVFDTIEKYLKIYLVD